MKEQLRKKNRKTISAGKILFSDSIKPDAGPQFRVLFHCRKDGFDYLGQLKADSESQEALVEIFNKNYFDLFKEKKSEVLNFLKDKTLYLLKRNVNLPESFRAFAGTLLKANMPEFTLEPPEEGQAEENKNDLQSIFDRLNKEYFKRKLSAKVEWAKNINTPNRRSLRFGSYDDRKKLIRIHPRLDQDFVPMSVLELTVYHEMCHQYMPPVRNGRKTKTHHLDFKKKEREYQNYREAIVWEKANWAKLLAPK